MQLLLGAVNHGMFELVCIIFRWLVRSSLILTHQEHSAVIIAREAVATVEDLLRR